MKKHFLMFAGEVVFRNKKNEDASISSIRINAVVPVDNENIVLSDIGKGQVALQNQFANRIGEEGMASIEIVDVVVYSISKLGHMTMEEFDDRPKAANDAE